MSLGRRRTTDGSLARSCREVLENAWDDELGYCYPHAGVYPHQWLWDSCFHAIAWAAIGDPRGSRELEGVFAAQLDNGFVPHMRYGAEEMFRGPLGHASSFTQPPIYAHAARYLAARGLDPGEKVVRDIGRALDDLWLRRRTAEGLVYIVHPWEAGSDDSPRWDSWVGSSDWNRHEWTAFDIGLIPETTWGEAGDATWCTEFVVAPAGFNALVAHALGEYAALTGDDRYSARRTELADLIDDQLWDETTGMWRDLPVVGGGSGESGRIPTLDGILPALVTGRQAHAQRALHQLCDGERFFAPYGPRFVPRDDPTYRADRYWRGAAWPQMSYLVWLAASRWGRVDCASGIAASATNGTVSSSFSEYWNPESGAACGATPQTWSAIAAAYLHDALTP
jgi:hypothetical protein